MNTLWMYCETMLWKGIVFWGCSICGVFVLSQVLAQQMGVSPMFAGQVVFLTGICSSAEQNAYYLAEWAIRMIEPFELSIAAALLHPTPYFGN